MYKITAPRTELPSDEVVQALRDGLGPGYNVLPGMRQTRSPFSEPVLLGNATEALAITKGIPLLWVIIAAGLAVCGLFLRWTIRHDRDRVRTSGPESQPLQRRRPR